MKLALKVNPAASATKSEILFHNLIKIRLCTRYPHAGIVIGPTLYHSTFRYGVSKTNDWTPEKWNLVELGGDDELAIERFRRREGKRYNLIGLLPFLGIPGSDSEGDYCYQLAYYMRTGIRLNNLVTAETLLTIPLLEN